MVGKEDDVGRLSPVKGDDEVRRKTDRFISSG